MGVQRQITIPREAVGTHRATPWGARSEIHKKGRLRSTHSTHRERRVVDVVESRRCSTESTEESMKHSKHDSMIELNDY